MNKKTSNMPAGYKQTDVGAIPEDWEVKSIGDVSSFANGKPYEPFINPNGTVCLITLDSISIDGKLKDHHKKVGFYDDSLKTDDLVVVLSDIAHAKLLGLGDLIPASDRFVLNQRMGRVRFTNDVFPEYGRLQINFRQDFFRARGQGTSQKHIYKRDVFSLQIPLPEKKEQKAIAQALSDIDTLITKFSKLIQKKRHIKQGAMQELLTGKRRLPGFSGDWKTTELGRVADITMGQSPLSKYYNKEGIGIPLIQGNADINNRRTIKRVFTTNITRKGKVGDIIMSVRAPVGEIAKTYFDVCLGRGVCSIRFENNYLYHAMIAHEPTWKKLSSGSTFDSVTSNDVKSFEIYLPKDEKEQTAISQTLSDMDAEIETLEKQKAKYINLKHGMMQQLLTGKIRLIKD